MSNTHSGFVLPTGNAVQTALVAGNVFYLQAYDTDLAEYVSFITLTANATPTCALSSDVIGTTQTPGDNSTKLATTAFVTVATGISPTELKISTASKGGILRCIDGAVGDTAITATGWIENEKYEWYTQQLATATSAEFDSAVKRTGKFTVKISATDATGKINFQNSDGVELVQLSNHAAPIKPSTKYIFNCYVKTTTVFGNVKFALVQYDGVSVPVAGTTTNTNLVTGTNDWTLLTATFTSDADAAYLWIKFATNAGSTYDIWIDVNSMTLEEVVTDTTFTGKVPEKIRPVLQATTSTDNLNKYLDVAGAYANTYAIPVAVDEGATHRQTFTPSRKYITQIAVWPIQNGTGDWTLIVHTAANVILAQSTIVNASVVEGAFLYFDVPNVWTSGTLHFHIISSVNDGTLKANTANDEETASYMQRFAKKSEDFTIVCNGIKTQLKADKDGILDGTIIDLDNAKYRYTNPFNAAGNFNDIFSASAGGGSTIPDVVSGWDWTNTSESISSVSGATAQNIVFKVNTILPIKHLKISTILFNNNVAAGQVAVSSDNVNYTDLVAQLPASASAQTNIPETDLMNGLSVFYLKIYKSTENTVLRIDDLKIEADLDTSRVPSGLFYPLATNQFTETIKLPAVATTMAFRTAKFTNEYGVVVPAIEFSSSATAAAGSELGYVPLKLDNSQETSPCVSILSTTTNYQQTGTGSAVTGGYVLNNGEYMTFTTTVAEIKMDYQVGGGTTAIAAITKNTLYLSSNAESVDSTQDPSHQMTAIVGVRQQGLVDRVKDLGDEVAWVRNKVVKSSVWTEWIPTLTWTTGTPEGSVVTKARYKIVDGVCYFNFYYSATDGNAATALTITLPVPPKDNDSVISLIAQEKSDTTWSDPLAYIDDGATTIAFRSLTTIADTKAVIVMVTGSYEI